MSSCCHINRLKALAAIAACSSLLLTTSAQAQNDTREPSKDPSIGTVDPIIQPTEPTPIDRNGRVLVREVKEDTTDSKPTAVSPNNNDVAPEIDRQIIRFELDRERWLKIVKQELDKVKRGVTEEERERLRLRMRHNLRLRWRTLSDERKEEGKARAAALGRKLAIKEVVDQAKEDARQDALQNRNDRVRGIE